MAPDRTREAFEISVFIENNYNVKLNLVVQLTYVFPKSHIIVLSLKLSRYALLQVYNLLHPSYGDLHCDPVPAAGLRWGSNTSASHFPRYIRSQPPHPEPIES